ncbi:hypothetical protein EG328_011669 [Venturia inaequalis]|uniref:Carboxylic ester hydrolase n=1 Tax=Venturia inaequalis TaxID=5025 RepID=A0A8H3VIB8_VENIN|nr:hypothetical protein EG328_011669 [Venturia inaequalis]
MHRSSLHYPHIHLAGTDSEDCLYLNVYAPLKPTSDKVPVFLYLPGGGFTSGGANSVYKFPDFWVEKEQSFIVITINYRVNLFGFPSAHAQPLNVGFLDQRLAVEWARDNIAAFGGDPSRITLWGQSAGASSVGAYSYAHYKDPIVAGLIADSGGASPATPDANHTSFNKLAGYVGCGGLDAHSQLTCVQKVDARTLQTLVSTNSSVSFRPVADNLTAFANITDRAAKGLLAKIPLITGSNSNEGAGFITWNGSYTPTAQQLASAGTRITCPIVNEVANRVKHGYTTYRYEYFGNFSNISPLPWIGASHSSELPLLFGTHWEYRGNSTPFEWEVSAGMQSLWESFVTDSSKDPSGSGVRWPKHVLGQNTMIEFASNNTVFQFGSVGSVDYLCE